MSKKWNSWSELFDELIEAREQITIRDCTIDKVKRRWKEYRKLDLIKTAPFSLWLEEHKNGNVSISLACHCCGKLWETKQ